MALVALPALAACRDDRPAAEAPQPVKTVTARLSAPERQRVYSGVVRPRIESALGFRVSGKLIDRLADTGDLVAAGQLLARIDPIDLKLAEAALQANVEAARSRRDVARAAFERSQALLARGHASKAAHDTARLELDAAQGALEAAEAQLRQGANQVRYAELRTERAGIVTGVAAEPGQVVSAGQPVITLAEARDVEIAVSLPENDLAAITIGMSATVSLWADARVQALGTVREIAGAADPATRTYAVRVSVAAPPEAMRLGMTAKVTFTTLVERHISVPLAAVTQHDGRTVVWVVDPTTATVEPRAVAVGRLADDGVRIASGLEGGEEIVAAGVQFLREGQRVRPSDRPAAVTFADQVEHR